MNEFEEFKAKSEEILNENVEKETREELVSSELISLFWNFIFEKLAIHFNDERIKLTDTENEFLTNATTKWLSYRLPNWIAKNTIDFEFIFALLTVVSSKLIIIRTIEKYNNYDIRTEGNRENNIGEANN